MMTNSIKASVIIVAGGSSSRTVGIDKIMYEINDKPILSYTIEKFVDLQYVNEIIVVTSKANLLGVTKIAKRYLDKVNCKVVLGGKTRQQSVFCGVNSTDENSDIFIIHDGARPFVSEKNISGALELMEEKRAITLGVDVKDTIKIVKKDKVVESLKRERLKSIQTPQIFKKELYFSAMNNALRKELDFTDDCQLIEAIGVDVYVSEGSYSNFKITTIKDLYIAEYLICKNGGN